MVVDNDIIKIYYTTLHTTTPWRRSRRNVKNKSKAKIWDMLPLEEQLVEEKSTQKQIYVFNQHFLIWFVAGFVYSTFS